MRPAGADGSASPEAARSSRYTGGLRERFELPIGEIARVRSHEKKELAFAPGVAQEMKSFELESRHAHTDRTSLTRPLSCRARRIRLLSPVRE